MRETFLLFTAAVSSAVQQPWLTTTATETCAGSHCLKEAGGGWAGCRSVRRVTQPPAGSDKPIVEAAGQPREKAEGLDCAGFQPRPGTESWEWEVLLYQTDFRVLGATRATAQLNRSFKRPGKLRRGQESQGAASPQSARGEAGRGQPHPHSQPAGRLGGAAASPQSACREAGRGTRGAHHGQIAQVLAHLASPLRGLQLQPLPRLLLAVGRCAAAVVAAVAGGGVEASLEELPPLPQLRIPARTPGVSWPTGAGVLSWAPKSKGQTCPKASWTATLCLL